MHFCGDMYAIGSVVSNTFVIEFDILIKRFKFVSMVRLVDRIEERPYLCEDCKHFLSGLKCKAFDIIPIEYYAEAEKHSVIVPDQKGDYVFETDKPRDVIHVYVEEEIEI